jgi:hypothetical protein
LAGKNKANFPKTNRKGNHAPLGNKNSHFQETSIYTSCSDQKLGSRFYTKLAYNACEQKEEFHKLGPNYPPALSPPISLAVGSKSPGCRQVFITLLCNAVSSYIKLV